MHFTSNSTNVDSISSMSIVHGDDNLVFPLSTYEKTTLRAPDKLFANVNAWLSTLTEERQQAAYDVYTKIHECYDDGIDYLELVDILIIAIRDLYEILDPEEIEQWLLWNGKFATPPDLRTSYRETDTPILTYLTPEYMKVMALTEILRFMLPIWGGLLKNYDKVIGTEWKEFAAWSLVGGSVLTQLPSVARIEEFIQASLPPTKVHLASSFAGLGSEDTARYSTAIAIIRKLAIGETTTPEVHLIKNVSNCVRNLAKGPQLDRRFFGESRLVDKNPPSEKDSPDNTSFVESYKTKQEYPDSVPIATEYSLKYYYSVARKACPDISLPLVKRCVAHTRKVKPLVTSERRQIAAIGLALSIEPEVLEAMDNETNWYAFGIAMAIYIHLGYADVAALLTAELRKPPVSMHTPRTLNAAIPKDVYLEKLDGLYYSDHATKATAVARKENYAFTAITSILNELGKFQLIVDLPKLPKGNDEIENGKPIPYTCKLGVRMIDLFLLLY